MIKTKTLLLLLLVSLASSLSAATAYVSDDLFTYIHSGPSTKHKLIGSVNAGDPIQLLQTNRDTGFTQIKDSKGRTGWINSKYVSKELGLKERLAKLEIDFMNLKAQLSAAEDDLSSHSSEVLALKNTNSTLNKELQEVKKLNSNLNDKLDTKKNDLLMQWFSYGGMVAGGGLLLGLILPSLMPSSRKKSRW